MKTKRQTIPGFAVNHPLKSWH